MPSCLEITRLLSQALERKLAPEEGAQVRRHLVACQSCKQYQQQLAAMRNMARHLADPSDAQAGSVGPRLSSAARRRMSSALGLNQAAAPDPAVQRTAPRLASQAGPTPAADVPEATIQVYIFREGTFLGSEMIDSTRIEVGRDLACDVVIEDELVSRRHAAVTLFRGYLYLEDLQSSNGTLVNGEEVRGRRPLSHRDEVGVGDHTLKFKALRGGAEETERSDQSAANIPDATEVRPMRPLREPPPPPVAVADSSPAVDAFAPPAVKAEIDGATEVVDQPPFDSDPVSVQDIFDAPTAYQDAEAYDSDGGLDPSLAALLDSDADLLRDLSGDEYTSDLSAPVATLPDSDGFPGPQAPAISQDARRAFVLPEEEMAVGHGISDETTSLDQPPAGPPAAPAGRGYDQMYQREPAGVPAYTPPPRGAPAQLRSAPPVDDQVDFTERIDTRHQLALERRERARRVGHYVASDEQPELGAPAMADWDDEDYDPDDEPAPYSLVENLLRERFAGRDVAQTARPVLEVIRYQGEVVKELQALTPGQGFVVGAGLKRAEAARAGVPANFRLARLSRKGEALLVVQRDFSGKVHQGGRSAPLDEACAWQGDRALLRLQAGDLANLHIGPDAYFVRFAFPPALLSSVTRAGRPTPEQRVERRRSFASFISSAGVHLSVLMVLYIFSLISPPQLVTQLEEDRFVQMEMKELELEQPPEEEAPQEEEAAEEAPAEEEPEPQPKKQRRLSNEKAEAPKKPGILAALGKIPKRAGPAGSQTLTAAVSNLDAVKVPGGGATYKVSGLIGKGPSNRVRIGGAGGGVATKGLASLLREGGGPGTLSKLKSGGVRGRLVKASRGSKMKGTGYLDRAEIQKVVNKGLGQIQFCYEKELLKNQSLSGKVVFEWTIAQSGSVSVVKTTTSTMRSPAAVTCMINAIKKWKFPKPRGNGTVIVTYPFIFNSMGF